MKNVKLFNVDVVQFRNDFEANGPMVPGLPPYEANERLRRFRKGWGLGLEANGWSSGCVNQSSNPSSNPSPNTRPNPNLYPNQVSEAVRGEGA
jgi:hypothetical protein